MKYQLHDIAVEVHLGVEAEERKEKQLILVDLEWESSAEKCIETDELSDTIDYFVVRGSVVSFLQKKEYKLLERLQAELKTELVQKFPILEPLKVTVTKFPFSEGSVTVSD